MIIISTTDEEEARDLSEILGTPGAGGIAWPYRIFLRGHEFRPGSGEPAGARVISWPHQLERSP